MLRKEGGKVWRGGGRRSLMSKIEEHSVGLLFHSGSFAKYTYLALTMFELMSLLFVLQMIWLFNESFLL